MFCIFTCSSIKEEDLFFLLIIPGTRVSGYKAFPFVKGVR
jgi:hypothetical protein